MEIAHVVGARPNFMKVAPVYRALGKRSGVTQTLVHTGQHYDNNMNSDIFRDLGLVRPDYNLEVGSGSHGKQTADVMTRCEELFIELKPDLIAVYGDVNSTLAAAIVAAKLCIPVAHVEAGLRSGDRAMPEEINRILTDQLSDFLLIPSPEARANLEGEGIAPEKIHFVGNVMIDTLIRLLPEAEALSPSEITGIATLDEYGLVTLHRPSNVDDPEVLMRIMKSLNAISERIELVFPVHPRTRKRLESDSAFSVSKGVHLVEPLGYLGFLALQSKARVVITDSGGIQEETTFLHVPCLTLRENTERPVTVTEGTNILIGKDMGKLERSVSEVLDGKWSEGTIPELWDGAAGQRIAEILAP